MNCYAYPILFDAVKSKTNNYILIEFYDNSSICIYRSGDFIHSKDREKEIIYENGRFNFFSDKPIDKITIIYNKYGPVYSDIFVRKYWRAATIIQNFFKNR